MRLARMKKVKTKSTKGLKFRKSFNKPYSNIMFYF